MGMPAGFWSTSGTFGSFIDNWSGYGTQFLFVTNPTLRLISFAGMQRCFQAPTSANQHGDDPGYNTGYFHLKQGAVEKAYANSHMLGGYPPDTTDNRQFRRPTPDVVLGDVKPETSIPTQPGKIAAYYVTPWLFNYGPPYPWFEGAVAFYMLNQPAGTYQIWHYQPYAWFEHPPAVVCRILMDAGLGTNYFDQDSCDDAYDENMAGTLHGGPLSICIWRQVGERVVDTVRRAMTHTRDYWGINEEGKFAIWSKTGPDVVSTLDYSDECQVIGDAEWEYTEDYFYNIYAATFGHCWRQWGVFAEPGNQYDSFGVTEEPQLSSHRGGKWSETGSNITSVAKFGERWLPGREDIVAYGGAPREVQIVHYPLYLDGSVMTSGGVGILEDLWSEDAYPRRRVKVRQGLIGLDTGIGSHVASVDLTGGSTFPARCIEKEIDFDNLTVTNTLIEESAI